MDRGAWWAAVHGVKESATEHAACTQLISNVLVPGVQQSGSVIHTHISVLCLGSFPL